jgi:hypothetical protein
MIADRPAGEVGEGRRQIVRHALDSIFHRAEVAVPKERFERILQPIDGL